VITSDVVDTVTFETEIWLKLRDRDFIKHSETETSKYVDFTDIFQKNVVITYKLNFFEFLAFSNLFRLFLTGKYNKQKTC